MLLRVAVGVAGGFGSVFAIVFMLFFLKAAEEFRGFVALIALLTFAVAFAFAALAPTARDAIGAVLLWIGEILAIAAVTGPIGYTRSALERGETLGGSWLVACVLVVLMIGAVALAFLYGGKKLALDRSYIPGWLRPLLRA